MKPLHPTKPETGKVCEMDVLSKLAARDLAICESFLRQNVGETAGESGPPELLYHLHERVNLNQTAKRRFAIIINRIIQAQEGISRRETDFIRQIWHESREGRIVGAPG